jgi:hypothetical protein
MPGYGVPEDAEGLLPWAWARERLERSHNYWLATTNPDGTPHVMPVWGIWRDDRFLFGTAPNSRKAKNFRRQPGCTVTTESAAEAVIVNGTVAEFGEPDRVADFIARCNAKYPTPIDESYAPFYELVPATAFGFIETDDQFARTATRWEFGG